MRKKSTRPTKKGAVKKKDWAAIYARRIERGIAQGKTRQQSRGHKEAREHAFRVEKGIARGYTRQEAGGKLPLYALSSSDLRNASSGAGKYDLLRKIRDSGDPELIKLYKQAKKENWRKRKKKSQKPTAMDRLLAKLYADEDEDTDYIAGES